jgi:hypothetical protein
MTLHTRIYMRTWTPAFPHTHTRFVMCRPFHVRNGVHMENPPQLARDTNNNEELISMDQLDNQCQRIVHEWSADGAYRYPLQFLKDTASSNSEDTL